MDNYYGRPSKATAASYLEKMDFDQALDEISDETRKAKKLLKSDSIVDYLIGMSYLQIAFYDGGHTYFPSECFTVSIEQPLSSVGKNINSILSSNSTEGEYLIDLSLNELASANQKEQTEKIREKEYKKGELVKSWDDDSLAKYYQSGDTGVFSFDSFTNDTVYHFKWSLDHAAGHGVRHFVIDLSTNGGGGTCIIMRYLLTGNEKMIVPFNLPFKHFLRFCII